ncbi:MAG: hypothetical protein QOC59_1004 [Microbacteriaceae bacterium]|jgi:hypothetical protein|nr:hypothetical protein [Microbacteriaceae bacterium]
MGSDADVEAVVATALDYYEGWFDGNAMRVGRAVHPQLANRRLVEGEKVRTETAEQLLDATADGAGRKRDVPERGIEVLVEHVHGSIASATVTSAVYVDYLHLVCVGGRWKIVNALRALA